MEERLRNDFNQNFGRNDVEEKIKDNSGSLITRFNYNRPKWFGGFFGNPKDHNKSGNCKYTSEVVLSPEELNKLIEPLYLMTPVLAYHLAITIFIALSLLITILQQSYNYLIQFRIVSNIGGDGSYLRTLGIIWYIVWSLGVVVIIPLYYVTLHNVERFFIEENNKSFRELGVNVKINKTVPSKFLLIPGFQKIESLEITKL